MRIFSSPIFIVAASFIFIFSNVPSVKAQDTGDFEFTLEEITVTAQKREENLQKVAVAMDAVEGDDLVALGKVNFYDALSNVTSVIMQEGTRGFVVSIRGMANIQGGQDSPVGLNIDGAYTNRQEAGSAGLLDVDRIEVLNGPQGTLQGRLATAGVVNIITKNPTDDFEASGLIEVGNYKLLHADGMLNVPLSDSWALRSAYRMVTRDGYLSNGENDADEKSARVKASFKPNDDFSLVLTGEQIRTGGRGKGSVYPFTDQPDDPWTATGTYSVNSYTRSNQYRYSADMDWDIGFGVLTLSPSYRDFYTDLGWMLNDNFQVRHETTEELASEMRLASTSESKMKWLFGLYYYDRDSITETYNPDEDGVKDNYKDEHGDDEDKAVFANISYPISDRFRLTGGDRYTWNSSYSITYDIEGEVSGTPNDDSLSNNDYKVGVEYDVSANSMLWADYSTGFRAGKMRNKPEHLKAYQLGQKTRYLDNMLQLNWSAFYYDYKGYQSEKNVSYPDGSWNSGAGSGDATIYGIDVTSNFILTDKDRFDLSVSYLHATYKNVVVTYDDDTLNPETGLVEPDEYYDGATMPHSPKWTISPAYEHIFYLQNGGYLNAHIDTRFQTKSAVAFAVDERYGLDEEAMYNKAHHISNVSLTYSAPNGKFSLSGFVKNIEDFAVKNHLLGETLRIGAPRTYAIQLSITY